MLMRGIKDASFLKFVPVERLSRSHGKQGRHRFIRHDTPSTAGDSARPSNRSGPLTESRRTRQINLFSTLNDLFRLSSPMPHKLCGTRRKGKACVPYQSQKQPSKDAVTEREKEPLSGMERPHHSRACAGLSVCLPPHFTLAVRFRAKQLKPCPGSIAC